MMPAGWRVFREATVTGIPLGDAAFLYRLEGEFSVRLHPGPRGTPPKPPAAEQRQLRLPASAV